MAKNCSNEKEARHRDVPEPTGSVSFLARIRGFLGWGLGSQAPRILGTYTFSCLAHASGGALKGGAAENRIMGPEEEHIVGFASGNLKKGLVAGYGVYATSKRLMGVKRTKQTLAGALVFGALLTIRLFGN